MKLPAILPTITLNGSPTPSLGDTITFTTTHDPTLDKYGVRIQLCAYQDGDLVYGAAGPHDQAFLLGGGSSVWLNSGAHDGAHCVAILYYWTYRGQQKFNPLATVEFEALGLPV